MNRREEDEHFEQWKREFIPESRLRRIGRAVSMIYAKLDFIKEMALDDQDDDMSFPA